MTKSMQILLKEALAQTVEKDGQEISRKDAIVQAVLEKAMRGDLPSINFIREMTETKTTPKAKPTDQIVRVKVITD